jgi:arginyl-tRNA synthetase
MRIFRSYSNSVLPIDIKDKLQKMVYAAVRSSFPDCRLEKSIKVTASQSTKFGHYQCIAAMSMSKELKLKPQDIAARIIETLLKQSPPEIFSSVTVAGSGFINFW